MTKLYFKNAQELVNFIMEVTKNYKFITINKITFYIRNCRIIYDENNYIDFYNGDNIIGCMRIKEINRINEYKIITEWIDE